MKKVEHSIALVTGANRGIGRAIVEELLARGASRVYAGVRNTDSTKSLVAQYGNRVVPLKLDVSVIGVYPGPVDTDMAAEVTWPKETPQQARDIQRQYGEEPKKLDLSMAAMAAAS